MYLRLGLSTFGIRTYTETSSVSLTVGTDLTSVGRGRRVLRLGLETGSRPQKVPDGVKTGSRVDESDTGDRIEVGRKGEGGSKVREEGVPGISASFRYDFSTPSEFLSTRLLPNSRVE